ncbi:MAG: hypothetical protein AAF602_24745, partial [Myxococcota bacterium]
ANRSGVEVQEILGGFEDFGEVLFDFTQGGGRAEEALTLLGFTADELAGRLDDVDGVAVDLIEKMRGIEDAGLRNAVAQQLFGDAGNRLNAILGDAPLEEWIAQAEELGVAVDQDAVKATEDWNRATAILGETLGQAGGDLITFLQQASSPVLVNFARGFEMLQAAAGSALSVVGAAIQDIIEIRFALSEGDFTGALDQASDLLSRQADDWTGVARAAARAGGAFNDTQTELEQTTDSTERQSTALKELTDDTDEQEAAQKRLNDATREAKREQDAYRAALAFNQSLVGELATAHDALGGIAMSAASDLLSPTEAVLAARDAELAKIRELEEVTGETTQSRIAAEEVFARAKREIDEQLQEDARKKRDEQIAMFGQISDASFRSAAQVTDAIGSFMDLQLATLEEGAQRMQANLAQTTSRIQELNALIVEETDERVKAELRAELDGLQQQQAAQAQALAERNEQLGNAFRSRKRLEVAGAIISGAAASVAALAPPPAGAGPIVGPFLIPGIVAATTAQVAVISAQQAPQFHTGFAGFTDGDDEFDVRMTSNESVNNARATEALGGPRGVAELNETGRLPAARPRRGMGASELGRMLGVLIADELDAGRELSRTVQRGRPRPGVRPVFAR